MRKILLVTCAVLFFGKAFSKNIDSMILAKVKHTFDSVYNQNLYNDLKGQSHLNNYLINVNVDEFNPYDVSKFVHSKVLHNVNDDANTIKDITTGTINDVNTYLTQINNKTKTIGSEQYFGVQFYLLLVSGIPISIEEELVAGGRTLHDIMSNHDKMQHLDLSYVVNDKKTKIPKAVNGTVDKELITASKNVLNELATLKADVNCKMFTNSSAYLKKPYYIFNITDLVINDNYRTTISGSTTYDRKVKRVNIWYNYTEGVTNAPKCNNLNFTYDAKVTNAYKALHSFFRDYKIMESEEKFSRTDVEWRRVLMSYISGFEVAQNNYLQMLELSVGAQQMIQKTKTCIEKVKTAQYATAASSDDRDKDICKCGMDNNLPMFFLSHPEGTTVVSSNRTVLYEKLFELDATGFSMFTKEERLAILKMLSAPKNNEGYGGDVDKTVTNLILYILHSFNTKEQAQYLIQELTKPNELARENTYSLLACLDNIVKNDITDTDGKITGGAYMFQFNNAIIYVFGIANKELIEDENKLLNNLTEPEAISNYIDARGFVHSPIRDNSNDRFLPNYDIRFSPNYYPVGTSTFKLTSFDKTTGKIKVQRSVLTGWGNRTDENGFTIIETPYRDQNGVLQISRKRVVTDNPVYKTDNPEFNPFDLVFFIASPDGVDLPSMLVQNNTPPKGAILIGPAYILKYRHEVERSIKIRKTSNQEDFAIDLGMNALQLIAPQLRVLSKLSFFFRAKSMVNINRLVQLGAIAQMTSSTANQIANGFGADKDKVTKFVDKVNIFINTGYLAAGATDMYMAYRIAKNQQDFLVKGAAALKEFYEEQTHAAMRNAVKNGSAEAKANANAMWDVAQYIDDYATKILKQSNGWYVEYGHSILNPQFGETYAYNKLLRTNFFTENALQTQILDKINGTPIVTSIAAKEEVTINLMINNAGNAYNEFKLVKAVKIAEGTNVVSKNLIVAKSANKAGILNTANYTANELTVAALNKMGTVYEEANVANGLTKILNEYKKLKAGTDAVKEENAIADLLKLLEGKASTTQLKELFTYLNTDAKAAQFTKDINQYSLLDDFAREGNLLDNYKAIRSNDFAGVKQIVGDIKNTYKQYYKFLIGNGSNVVTSSEEFLGFVIKNNLRNDINIDFIIKMCNGRRDLVESILLSTKEVVEGKNISQLVQHFNIPTIPVTNSLSNYKARIWYHFKKSNIPNIIDKTKSLEEQALEAFNLRNLYRTQTRNYMNNRPLAEFLDANEQNLIWQNYKTYLQNEKGLSGESLWNYIINSSTSGRDGVDALFKL